MKNKQIDLEGNVVEDVFLNDVATSGGIFAQEIPIEFVYQNKVLMITDDDVLKITYKSHLYDELIQELTKLYNYLGIYSSFSTFIDIEGNKCTIEKKEVDDVIRFFDKLKKIPVM